MGGASDNLFLWTEDIIMVVNWIQCNPYNLYADSVDYMLKKKTDSILKAIEMEDEQIEAAANDPFYRDLPKNGQDRNRFAL